MSRPAVQCSLYPDDFLQLSSEYYDHHAARCSGVAFIHSKASWPEGRGEKITRHLPLNFGRRKISENRLLLVGKFSSRSAKFEVQTFSHFEEISRKQNLRCRVVCGCLSKNCNFCPACFLPTTPLHLTQRTQRTQPTQRPLLYRCVWPFASAACVACFVLSENRVKSSYMQAPSRHYDANQQHRR